MQKSLSGPARKTAFVFTSMPVGGAEDFALGVGPHLAPEFEAHYVCLREYGRLGEEAKAAGRHVHLMPAFRSRWITPWNVRRFASWLRRENIAIVHSQTHHAHVFATRAAQIIGIPSVVHQQKTLEKLPLRREMIFRACLRRASRVLSLSGRTADGIARKHGISRAAISVVPNGIEKSIFKPAVDRAALRRSLGLPSDGLLVGTVGRLHAEKSHVTTMKAVEEARNQGAKVSAVFVGEGALRSELERLAGESSNPASFIFAGARRPVLPWLQALDVFVLASVWEGQPLALFQAIACGVPVLASKIEGNTSVLGEEHPGLFSPLDHRRLAEMIVDTARDPGFSERLLRSQAQVDLPWSENAGRQLSAIYKSLLP